jgi:hypothetical protein
VAHARRMARSKGTSPPKEHVAVRLEAPIIARLEALLPLYGLPGRAAKRSDVLRGAILAGLGLEEARASQMGLLPPKAPEGKPIE